MDPTSSAQMPPGSDLLSILALGSTALSSIGALGQGFANSSLAQFQASIANSNAQMLTQQAGMQAKEGQLSLDEGALQMSRIANTVSQTIGAETGKFAASNLNPAYGSPLVLEGFTAGQGETDEALAGAQASMGYAGALQQSASTLTQAASQTGQAAAFGMQSTSDIMSSIFGAGTILLKGLSADNGTQWSALTGAAENLGSGLSNVMSSLMVVGG